MGLRLLVPNQMNDGHDSVRYHVRRVAMIIGTHQKDDYLYIHGKDKQKEGVSPTERKLARKNNNKIKSA